jgi:hypothetical protein
MSAYIASDTELYCFPSTCGVTDSIPEFGIPTISDNKIEPNVYDFDIFCPCGSSKYHVTKGIEVKSCEVWHACISAVKFY